MLFLWSQISDPRSSPGACAQTMPSPSQSVSLRHSQSPYQLLMKSHRMCMKPIALPHAAYTSLSVRQAQWLSWREQHTCVLVATTVVPDLIIQRSLPTAVSRPYLKHSV